jgi:hypothetical protein
MLTPALIPRVNRGFQRPSRVHCGGRNLPLVTNIPKEILPLVTRRFIGLKRPYAHYPAKVA